MGERLSPAKDTTANNKTPHTPTSPTKRHALVFGGSSQDVSSSSSLGSHPPSSFSSNSSGSSSPSKRWSMGGHAHNSANSSRIPVLNRSPIQGKVPAQISFGQDAQRAFLGVANNWYNRNNPNKGSRNAIHIERNNFEVDMKDALDL